MLRAAAFHRSRLWWVLAGLRRNEAVLESSRITARSRRDDLSRPHISSSVVKDLGSEGRRRGFYTTPALLILGAIPGYDPVRLVHIQAALHLLEPPEKRRRGRAFLHRPLRGNSITEMLVLRDATLRFRFQIARDDIPGERPGIHGGPMLARESLRHSAIIVTRAVKRPAIRPNRDTGVFVR